MADLPDASDYAPTSLPSPGARVLAFTAILVGGLCGGLIGYGFTELQCAGDCSTLAAAAGLFGAVLSATGVGVVAILALRAMAPTSLDTQARHASRGVQRRTRD